IVVSIGSNYSTAAALPALQELLPVALPTKGRREVPATRLIWASGAGGQQDPLANADGGAPLTLAAFAREGERSARLLRPVDDKLPDDPALIPGLVVQGACGRGRVTVVGFDLDRPPFTKWPGRDAFLERLREECGLRVPPPAATANTDDQYLGRLGQHLERFEGVRVVSFGWVAFFILAYIILIGPLDYFFLK